MSFLVKPKVESPHSEEVTEAQFIDIQYEIIDSWRKPGEVWALQYAPGLCGIISGLTGIFINSHFRLKLKLGSYGRLSSYLPIVFFPAVSSTMFQKIYVQQRIFLSQDKCPMCLQTKASLVQAGLGLAYPLILAPLASLMFATRHFTYRLPSITSEPKAVFALFQKFTKPINNTLLTLFFVHLALGMVLTYKQQEGFQTVLSRVMKIEKQLDNVDQ